MHNTAALHAGSLASGTACGLQVLDEVLPYPSPYKAEQQALALKLCS